jgi:Flp pilus assembly protein TadG
MRIRTDRIWSRLQRQDGQAFVEFAIVLPILALLTFGIVQFGVAFHDYISLTDAARVGARAAAVKRTTGACDAAKDAIHNTAPNQWSKISTPTCSPVGVGNVGDPFTVSFVYKFEVPYVGVNKDLTISATERLE